MYGLSSRASAQPSWRWRTVAMAAGAALALAVLATLPQPLLALTLTKVESIKPAPGVTVEHYKVTTPKAHVWVAKIELCTSGVHLDATRAPKSLQTAAAWGAARGAKLVTNGDFYKTGPVRVYGDAVGEGIRWPLVQTGLDPAYKSEWYWNDAGWIAFLHDGVQFSHTGWQKKNGKGLVEGWSPTQVTAALPAGVLALVGGFPELVIEGKVYTCANPTADTCFPDRSDMRARHPRTAMGLTADLKTFLLVVVDGRTSTSIGMYGTELAELMGQLGAHEAFNLDGGGSSQLWVAGEGTINDADGNNNGGGLRTVANHWGVLAGSTTGYPARPGHCVAQPVCAAIPAAGATLEETSACFRMFGTPANWHSEKVGSAGALRWTNAGNDAAADNWAWWRLELAEAGTYKVEVATYATYGKFKSTHYDVRAAGVTKSLTKDQSQSNKGWIDLGTYAFAAGGAQWVAVFDDHTGAPVKDQHIVADAVRLTRLEPWCGSGTCGGAETCTSCPADCGVCPPVCGDGDCKGGETCTGCPADCGVCPPTCGDGDCNGAETCKGCPADCGVCPVPDAGGPEDAGIADGSSGNGEPIDVGASDGQTIETIGGSDGFSGSDSGDGMPDSEDCPVVDGLEAGAPCPDSASADSDHGDGGRLRTEVDDAAVPGGDGEPGLEADGDVGGNRAHLVVTHPPSAGCSTAHPGRRAPSTEAWLLAAVAIAWCAWRRGERRGGRCTLDHQAETASPAP